MATAKYMAVTGRILAESLASEVGSALCCSFFKPVAMACSCNGIAGPIDKTCA